LYGGSYLAKKQAKPRHSLAHFIIHTNPCLAQEEITDQHYISKCLSFVLLFF